MNSLSSEELRGVAMLIDLLNSYEGDVRPSGYILLVNSSGQFVGRLKDRVNEGPPGAWTFSASSSG